MNTPSDTNVITTQPFAFGDHLLRVTDRAGSPWFVAKDICRALGLGNVAMALRPLDDDEVNQIDLIDSMGRTQKTNIVSESGMYTLVLRSDKPEARPFRKWITSEVIPSIRKTGTYTTRPEPPTDYLSLLQAQLDNGVDPTVAARIASRIHLAHAAGVQRSSRTYAAGSQGSGRPQENPLDLILPHLQPGQLYTIPQLLSFLPETHHLRRQRPAVQNSALGRHIRSCQQLLRDWSIPRTAHYHLRPA